MASSSRNHHCWCFAIHSRAMRWASAIWSGVITLGLFTRLAALFVFIEMCVLVFSFHMPNGFFNFKGGYEFPLLWGIAALFFLIRGGGRFSLDAKMSKEF